MPASRTVQTDDELRLLQPIFRMYGASRFQLGEHLKCSTFMVTDLSGNHPSVEEIGWGSRPGTMAVRPRALAADRIIQQAGNRIGQALAGPVNFMNPFFVLIGGGVCSTEPLSTCKLHARRSSLGDAASLRGAVGLAAYSSVLQGRFR